MKNKFFTLTGILVFSSIWIVFPQITSKKTTDDPVPGSCTIFSASFGDKVFFGNNEDYYKPKTYLWTDPATTENYGCVYLGFKNYAHQGGINEKGLCFDANALPESKLNPHFELEPPPVYEPPYEDYIIWLPVLILRKAATVEEAIEIAGKYQRKNWYPDSGAISYQLNFADAKGDAVVISVDENGELAFTRKKKDENYLISTNYNKANPENALEYPCQRYNKAEEMLEAISSEKELSVDYFKSILDSVHEEGVFNNTLYSNIFDLKNGIIYLYHWHQFDEVAVLKVNEELAKGSINIRIKDLFSQETARNASRAYIVSIFLLCLSIVASTGAMVAVIHYIKKRKRKTKVANNL
ncbi:carcinine hydrolase/isopenicillin-N N-acyltransferase family protein [Flavivirga algicola]|uniref:Peptidase C45 hydrolase domain-containing protein n=1 Tax=Flavivirga algicola TaxID=2729136 RepID=A0ABX1S1U3_9FLAO|nr:carcinine hydrolase/isopenicillin-N N-acyltransferase family protein [Flavivirga algicola]NMH89008.1 hypothetical protein [Flavivirga algicola]